MKHVRMQMGIFKNSMMLKRPSTYKSGRSWKKSHWSQKRWPHKQLAFKSMLIGPFLQPH